MRARQLDLSAATDLAATRCRVRAHFPLGRVADPRTFFRWYIPRFSATSFPLARANEYEADAAAIKLTSARSAAQALTAVSIVGSYLSEKYWPRIHSAARESPQPAFAPYSEFIATAIQDVPDH